MVSSKIPPLSMGSDESPQGTDEDGNRLMVPSIEAFSIRAHGGSRLPNTARVVLYRSVLTIPPESSGP